MLTTSQMMTYLTDKLGVEKLKAEMSKRRGINSRGQYVGSAGAIQDLYNETIEQEKQNGNSSN